MKIKLIGVGAAGNKAVIEAVEQGVVDKESILLLNSTLQDIPVQYREPKTAVCFSSKENSGGCGKEPQIAEGLIMEALQNGTVNLDGLMEPDDRYAVIVTSSEGGSGCGASTVIAKYLSQVLDVHVHMVVFTGFEEDARGLQNTVHYFQNLSNEYTIEVISNKKFFKGNKLKAEREANAEFVKKLSVLLCNNLIESDQNMDETDQIKLTTTPGFMVIEARELDKIKSVEQFDQLCYDMIANSSSLDFEPSAIRLGIVLNVTDKTKEYIDYTFSAIKERVGLPYEIYTHVQYDKNPEYIEIIAAGMKMPEEDIDRIYKKYQEETSKINKKKDSFFGNSQNMKFDESDEIFNLGSTKKTDFKNVSQEDKDRFFKVMEKAKATVAQNKAKFFNTVKSDL